MFTDEDDEDLVSERVKKKTQEMFSRADNGTNLEYIMTQHALNSPSRIRLLTAVAFVNNFTIP